MKKLLIVLTITAGIGLVISSCKKEMNDGRKAEIQVRLTDDPCDCQQVNIDLKEIQVKLANDTTDWIPLTTYAGIYDLLLFQNIDTTVATGFLPLEVIQEIRLVLGPDNTVMVNGEIHDLETPSAQSSGLKVKINKQLGINLNTFLLDFDAAASVKQLGNGKYQLHPVIRLQ